MSDDGFAGLPTIPTADGELLTRNPDEPYVEYTLPESKVGLRFAKRFHAADRTFHMIEITPAIQDKCAKNAGGNPSVLSRLLIWASIAKVGDWDPRRDYDTLGEWWTAIGSKGRRLVEAAFMRMQSVEDTDVETFLASGRAG